MTYQTARQRLLKWKASGSTILVRLNVEEASSMLFGKITDVLDDRVMLEVDIGRFRVSLIGQSFEEEPKFGTESLTIRYPSGYCTFTGWASKNDVELPDIISDFEQ